MITEYGTMAQGTAILVISQSCYFVLGYVAVVLMAREFGPAAYGAYGVIMSVLVWLEESGRFAIPSATAKLVAETTMAGAALERTALTLNLALYGGLFVVMWTVAPWLEPRFGIENGAFLFRVAALDLPFFGAYTV
jgi:O-antigen/teichoic acid export membrane protein